MPATIVFCHVRCKEQASRVGQGWPNSQQEADTHALYVVFSLALLSRSRTHRGWNICKYKRVLLQLLSLLTSLTYGKIINGELAWTKFPVEVKMATSVWQHRKLWDISPFCYWDTSFYRSNVNFSASSGRTGDNVSASCRILTRQDMWTSTYQHPCIVRFHCMDL